MHLIVHELLVFLVIPVATAMPARRPHPWRRCHSGPPETVRERAMLGQSSVKLLGAGSVEGGDPECACLTHIVLVRQPHYRAAVFRPGDHLCFHLLILLLAMLKRTARLAQWSASPSL